VGEAVVRVESGKINALMDKHKQEIPRRRDFFVMLLTNSDQKNFLNKFNTRSPFSSCPVNS
jgi:hypothetical protein